MSQNTTVAERATEVLKQQIDAPTCLLYTSDAADEHRDVVVCGVGVGV